MMFLNDLVKLSIVLGIFCVETLGAQPVQYFTDNNELIDIDEVSGIFARKPYPPTKLNTSYFVYDQGSRNSPKYVIRWNDSFVTRPSMFEATDEIKVIIHGYSQNYTYDWVQQLKNAFIDRGNENTKVLLVDWSVGSQDGSSESEVTPYIQACNNVFMEAQTLAASLQRMVLAYSIPERNLHIMGQSLGAQLMGLTARHLVEDFNIKIGRASATDTASPVIGWAGNRPDKSHAHFMEAIHTASAFTPLQTATGAVGIYEAYAHVDLYPNRGVITQPPCRENRSFLCSHNQANIYYIEIVKQCDENHDFYGRICPNVPAATLGLCSSDAVGVCELIENEYNRPTHAESSIIVYFTTNGAKLNMTSINEI